MQAPLSITAVIPNWNGRDRLVKLLDDLHKQSLQPVEILVVDNGSRDDSVEQAKLNGARAISLPSNMGFAHAVNRGVAESLSPWVAVINNDVHLPPDWLDQLAGSVRGERDRFAVGKLLKSNDRTIIDGCYDAICRGGCAWRCGDGRPDGPVWSAPGDVAFPPFTAVLLHREFYLDLGGLDESFGSYLEDVDFGLRCASKGYTGRYVPDAVAFHEGSGTLGRWNPVTVRQIARNQLLLVAKYYRGSMLLRFGWAIAVSHLLWGVVALQHGAGLAWLSGKIDGMRLFASVRRIDCEGLPAVLRSSESEIRRLQQLTGWDWFWRIYFALT